MLYCKCYKVLFCNKIYSNNILKRCLCLHAHTLLMRLDYYCSTSSAKCNETLDKENL